MKSKFWKVYEEIKDLEVYSDSKTFRKKIVLKVTWQG